MRLPVIILLIVALGLGFAAGSYFHPVSLFANPLAKPVESESTSTTRSDSSTGSVSQVPSTPTAGKLPPTLSSLLQDSGSNGVLPS